MVRYFPAAPVAALTLLAVLTTAPAHAAGIVHDGEYTFLEAQHGEAWAAQDAAMDKRLAEIRDANGGKRPNILYILIDDVSFGLMGDRAMNFVTGIDTSNINAFAKEGLSLMRMYTEPSCTPTATA